MNRNAALLLAALAIVAAVVAAVRAPLLANSIQDDGFIYFRIAENAASGWGPVFNPGERVDAATSPVWLWILVLATWLRIPPHVAAATLGLLAALASVLASARWALELAKARSDANSGTKASPASLNSDDSSGSTRQELLVGTLALSGAATLALDDRILVYAFSGMETLLCAATWVWAVRGLVRRWLQELPAPGAGWWALAAALVRPEFVLLVLGIAAVAVLRSKAPRASLRTVSWTLLPAIVGGIAYLGAHLAYFGDPLPNTYYAKRAADWEHARIGMDYVVGFVRAYPWVLLTFLAVATPVLRPVFAAVGTGLLLFVVHVVRLGGDHFEYHRAFIHVLPICAALIGAGAAHLIADGVEALERRVLKALRSAAISAALVGMLFLAGRSRVSPDAFQWVQVAARMGVALAETYPSDTHVGLFALGAMGYTSRLPIVDALGIADEHVARRDLSSEHVCHLDIGHERGDPDYVLERADVVVLFAAYAPVQFETLQEVREGFYSHKKFVAAAKQAIQNGSFVLRNIEFMPGVYWAVLERVQASD